MTQADIQAITAELQAISQTVPNFSAVVELRGEPLISLNPDIALCACSTTKVAAVMAVMTLAQEGRVDLDQPVIEADRRLAFHDPERGRRITLRMLLSHTSGVSDTEQVEDDPLACLPGLPHVADPARAFRYSNVGFACGVMAAARQVDLDYHSLIEQRVLQPLRMGASRWRPRFGVSSGHGVLASTAGDLTRLARELMGAGHILAADALAEMSRAHADSWAVSGERYYGLGLGIERWEGLELLAHGGGLANFGSTFLLDAAAGASVVMLFDHPAGYGAHPHGVLDRVLDRVTRTPEAQPLMVDWREWLGKYANGAELFEDGGRPYLRYGPIGVHMLESCDERLLGTCESIPIFGTVRRVGVGLLPGEPRMLVVNHFPPIGARPGRRL